MFEWQASDWVGQIRQAGDDKFSIWIPKEKLIYVYDPRSRKVLIVINYFNSFDNYYISKDFHYIILKTMSGFRIMDVRLNKIILEYNKIAMNLRKSTPFLSHEFEYYVHKIIQDCNYQGYTQVEKKQLLYWCLEKSLIVYNKSRNQYQFERSNTLKQSIFIREGEVQFSSMKQNQYLMQQNQQISLFIRLNKYQKRVRVHKVPLNKFQVQISSKYLLISQIQVERFYENLHSFSKKEIIMINICNMKQIQLDKSFRAIKYILYSNKDVIGQIEL